MITTKMLENANKVTFLFEAYPEHTVNEVIKLLEMPAIDINAGIWAAQELGFITAPDPVTNHVTLIKKPDLWDFGDAEGDLEEAIMFSFQQLAKKETDLEEQYLAQWTQGYPAHDVLIALKQLLADKQLATYELEDKEADGTSSTYTFYTLYENGEQLWGKKQFKQEAVADGKVTVPTAEGGQPIPGEEPEQPDVTTTTTVQE